MEIEEREVVSWRRDEGLEGYLWKEREGGKIGKREGVFVDLKRGTLAGQNWELEGRCILGRDWGQSGNGRAILGRNLIL